MNRSTISTKRVGMISAACLLALFALFAFVQPLQAVVYLPDVTDEMTDPAYWSSKQDDADEVLATRSQIDAINQAGIDADGTYLQPLKNAREYYFDAQKQASIKNSAAQELAASFVGQTWDLEGNLMTQEDADEILANYPTDGMAPDIPSQYGIVTTHTTMRCYPTDRMLGYTEDDQDDDSLYLAALRVNEPVIIREQSVDGNYYLCISQFLGTAWVPAEDVAVCSDKEEWLAAWDILEGQELVVTGYKVRTEQTRVMPNTSNRLLYMGTVLERCDILDPTQMIGTRATYNNYVCYLPVRNSDGTYSKELALVAQSASVNEGYLPLTKTNIAKVAFSSLGNMYGWGGMLEANDCSGYVRDVYKCFGLELARNTTWQQNLPVRKYDLSQLDDAHKAAAIAQMPLGTVLFFRGHEMLYLGQDNGKLYVISSLGAIGDVYGTSNAVSQVKVVVINTLDIVRSSRATWLSSLTAANIPYISKDVEGPGVYDLAFYEKALTGLEASYVATGSAITPDVELTGLVEETDYTVSYANNVNAGMATVTLTGTGDYTGTIEATFEITAAPEPEPASIAGATVTAADQAYTGSAIEPAVTVTLDGKTLVAGTDYTVSYADNTEVGTATVTVTGKGDYTGTAAGTFEITAAPEPEPASIAGATVAVADQVYTGSAIEPAVTVTLDGKTLVAGTDYTVSYADNTEVGTATVTVAGKGDYTGTAAGTFEITAAPEPDPDPDPVDRAWTRLAGSDRFGTMKTITLEGYESADTVLVATGIDFADALAAAGLSGVLKAPIVTTMPDSLSTEARDAIKALGAKNAIILGGESAVSADVEKQLEAMGMKTSRIAGDNRIDTAVKIWERGGFAWGDTCILSKGWVAADALAAGSFAYADAAPLFLAMPDGTLTPDTAAAVKKFEHVIVLGGTGGDAAISDKTAKSLGTSWMRVAGDTRYETAVALATWASGGDAKAAFQPEVKLSWDDCAVAFALNYPDALVGVNATGPKASVTLLASTDADDFTQGVASAVAEHADEVSHGYVLGGTGVVSDAVKQLFEEAAR